MKRDAIYHISLAKHVLKIAHKGGYSSNGQSISSGKPSRADCGAKVFDDKRQTTSREIKKNLGACGTTFQCMSTVMALNREMGTSVEHA
jgi:hypothetical protein